MHDNPFNSNTYLLLLVMEVEAVEAYFLLNGAQMLLLPNQKVALSVHLLILQKVIMMTLQ